MSLFKKIFKKKTSFECLSKENNDVHIYVYNWSVLNRLYIRINENYYMIDTSKHKNIDFYEKYINSLIYINYLRKFT